MKIDLKLFATLAQYAPPRGRDFDAGFELPDGVRVADLIDHLTIPHGAVKLVFVNGRHANSQTVLKNGDRVGLFPPVGGG